jgi:hypothetical protein
VFILVSLLWYIEVPVFILWQLLFMLVFHDYSFATGHQIDATSSLQGSGTRGTVDTDGFHTNISRRDTAEQRILIVIDWGYCK